MDETVLRAIRAVRRHFEDGGFLSGPDYLSTGEVASPTNWGDPDVLSDSGRESLELGLQRVIAGREGREAVIAVGVRDPGPRAHQRRRRDRHRHARRCRLRAHATDLHGAGRRRRGPGESRAAQQRLFARAPHRLRADGPQGSRPAQRSPLPTLAPKCSREIQSCAALQPCL